MVMVAMITLVAHVVVNTMVTTLTVLTLHPHMGMAVTCHSPTVPTFLAQKDIAPHYLVLTFILTNRIVLLPFMVAYQVFQRTDRRQ